MPTSTTTSVEEVQVQLTPLLRERFHLSRQVRSLEYKIEPLKAELIRQLGYGRKTTLGEIQYQAFSHSKIDYQRLWVEWARPFLIRLFTKRPPLAQQLAPGAAPAVVADPALLAEYAVSCLERAYTAESPRVVLQYQPPEKGARSD